VDLADESRDFAGFVDELRDESSDFLGTVLLGVT
jgi:hypothetical protein